MSDFGEFDLDEDAPDFVEPFDEEPERETPYQSRDGFETLPIRGGFEPIRPLWSILDTLGAGLICGGYARSCAAPGGAPAGDVDVYCCTDEDVARIRDALIAAGLKEKRENIVSVMMERPETGPLADCPPIQIIKPIFEEKTVQGIIGKFDFTVIRVGIVSPLEVLADADFEHDEDEQFLRIKYVVCPVSSVFRLMKYAAKGYTTSIKEIVKLFVDWEGRDADYRANLIDLVNKMDTGELSEEDIQEMERLLRID